MALKSRLRGASGRRGVVAMLMSLALAVGMDLSPAAADEMQVQRQEMMLLQEQIDSLKGVAAKQDTLLKRLANLAGISGTGEPGPGTR